MEGRRPPQDTEAEQAVIAAMMLKKDAAIQVSEMLQPEDFYRQTHRLIYEAIRDLMERGEPVDIITLTEQLKKTGALERVGGIQAVGTIANAVPTAANVMYHAKIVREKAQLRSLINVASEIESSAYEEAGDVADLMDEAEKKILAVASNPQGGAIVPMKELLLESFMQIEARHENKGKITGISTGFADLNKLTAGLQRSDLILVAARPSMGKTAFTLNIAANVALRSEERRRVAFFSLEMSAAQLVQRLLCAEARIDASRLRIGELEDADWGRLMDAANRLTKAEIFIDDTPGITAMELRSKARRIKAEKGGLDLIIIDYLQLMQGRASKGSDNRQQEISEISRSLKALARELNVPLIALSQLSRGVESRQIKRPMLSDLRESGSLEQDADIVMFLYREDYYDPDTENKNITEVIVAKHRNGPVDTVNLTFLKEFTRFMDIAYMQ